MLGCGYPGLHGFVEGEGGRTLNIMALLLGEVSCFVVELVLDCLSLLVPVRRKGSGKSRLHLVLASDSVFRTTQKTMMS